MSQILRAACIFGLVAVIILTARLGLFMPADQALASARFSATDRAPSQDIVFVEIDAQSLAGVGVWPWPRSVHGRLLDALMTAGAAEVVFDVDFSVASSEAEDRAFEEALERAGGYAYLAAFRQLSGDAIVLSYPLARFAQWASAVLVNVEADAGGLLRTVPAGLVVDGVTIPSIAVALGQPAVPPPESIALDFGIDVARIERISAIDVLDGQLDPARVADKQIVIGASALELRDFFSVPRWGIIPGPMAQILATETVKANRSLLQFDLWPAGVLVVLAGLLALWGGTSLALQRKAMLALVVGVSLEVVAWLVLRDLAITFATVPVHMALSGLLGLAFLDERATRWRQHQRVRAQRATMQQMLSQVVTDSFDGIVIIDERGMIVAASEAASGILALGMPLVDQPMAEVLPPEMLQVLALRDSDVNECICRIGLRRRVLDIVATRSQVPDPDQNGQHKQVLCVTFKDITERRLQAEQLTYLAGHDALTGALSRHALEGAIAAQIAQGQPITGVLVRMDRLRSVSATLGHDLSDSVLCEIHARLEALLSLPVARLGSDIFAFAWPRLLMQAELETQLAKLGQVLDAPYQIEEHTVLLSSHFGVSSTVTCSASASELFRQAEIALRSNPSGGATHMVYAAAEGERMRKRQALDIALWQGLQAREFKVVYQPQIDLASGEMAGVEALVRWKSATLGNVSPAEFIPLAEETGLIIALGDWVLREACRQAAGWNWNGRLSVNVSAVQFKLADVVQLVEEATRETGFPANRLDIEITESLYVGNDLATIAALKKLQTMGVKIAIDDFGTGYSSLSYLARLPADKIKVDQSFVRSLPDPDSQTIVETIINMAQRLGLAVIAEGVETTAQRDYLQALGCDVGQGYLFSRPVAAEELGLSALKIAV